MAGLEWENTRLELPAEAGQEEVIGVFAFKNTSDHTISIVSTQSSCGCTVPKLAKKTYAPGESGELTAIFTVGGRTGPQHKTITVKTDEPGQPDARLQLETNIPTFVKADPRMLVWSLGSEADWKKMTITTDPDNKVFIKPKAESPTLPPYEIAQGNSPGQYILSVHPVSTAARDQIRFPLTVEFPNGLTKPYTVFLLVR